MPISRYAFPLKVKIVSSQRGRPHEKYPMRKLELFYEYCKWASLPTPLREPKTQKEWAKKWGVTEATLSIWKRKQKFWEMVASFRREWAKDKTSDVIYGLFRNASTRGEAAEVKLWLQSIEDWSEKVQPQQQNITIIGIKGITDEDLKKLTQPVQEEVEDVQVLENAGVKK
jgi:hypothetical protein